ncbi:DUF3800 domain-containing protein [Salmonella enterica]|uniref:DUF3800 domain-containing protein n=1 Tax=Salmonella enterica subsp. salamae TaxID=59202 RepID=A0A8E6IDZ3_SALER|nr:DUF3800 domain-containing protein [Salmonella enterica]EBU7538847.1 DUF3800 domain-containing protein [Salmonella enterica subsp. salamae serovar Sofia]EGF4898693.1 DUF3800 domain-containing protein [Salmonella enterica subsp. enterica serovar Bredeney]QVP48879.1 DUF3800 domain-containing protein [Salmonella enterica subsp. salamae]EDK0166801.1 DUF3800 domain-containing protein [Salmonella enterica]EDK0173160.1 DUF3800 domain-containing protein [Salmonella enterica]
MQMLFVDESGTPPPISKTNHTPFFVLGGVCIPEVEWKSVAISLDKLKASFGVTEEIKWRHFSRAGSKNKGNGLCHLSDDERERFRDGIYNIIETHQGVKVICVACHTENAYKTSYMGTPDALYMHCYKKLTERFQYYLQDLSKLSGCAEYGIVVCDHRGSRDDEKLREHHDKLMKAQLSKTSDYQNIIGGLFISPSHLSVGIQLADMVAGAVLRSCKNGDRRFSDKFKGSYRRSSEGKIEGFGAVKLPHKTW